MRPVAPELFAPEKQNSESIPSSVRGYTRLGIPGKGEPTPSEESRSLSGTFAVGHIATGESDDGSRANRAPLDYSSQVDDEEKAAKNDSSRGLGVGPQNRASRRLAAGES